MIIHNPILTGSFTVNGTDVSSITSSAASLTSLNAYTASQNIRNGTYATTGSNTFAGIQTVNSNLVVTGSITAATLVVQTITSSIVYSSGSNVFGNNIANTQVLTGSVNITGSLAVITNGTEFQVTSTGVNFGNIIGDTHNITGSLRVSGSTTTFTNTETTFNFNPQTSLLSGYNYLNFGCGSIMYRNATDVYFGSNAKYGSAGTVVANYTSANGMGLLTMDGGALRWQANNTSVTAGTAYGVPIRFAINGDGNVGIGTASPSTAGGAYTGLDIRGSGGGSIYLGSTSTAFGLVYADSGALTIQTTSTIPIVFLPGGTERFRIGNVNARNAEINLVGNVISSFSGTGGTRAAGASWSMTLNQVQFEFESSYIVDAIGFYAPGGVNIQAWATGIIHFMADGSTNGAHYANITSNGISISVSATNAGVFTVTFTNTSGASMGDTNARIIKINRMN